MLPIQALPLILILLAIGLAVVTWLLIGVVLPYRREQREQWQREQDEELERAIADFDWRHRGDKRS